MTTPAGFPPWQHLNTFETYGGRTDKRDWGSIGPINGQTDVGADEFVAITRDVAAAQRTAPWATLKVQLRDTTPDDPLILEYEDMANAAGPASITRIADNDFRIVWDAAPPDAFGVTGNLNVIGARATVQGTQAGVFVDEPEDINTDTYFEAVRFRGTVVGAGALTNPTVTIVVYTGQTV